MKDLRYLLDTCPDFLKKEFTTIHFKTFDKIILQDEISNFVYIMKKGKAKVYSLTTNGINYLEHIYHEYELFGELEVFLDKPALAYVEALENSQVIQIPKKSFLEWIRYDSDFSLYINTKLSEKMYNTCINTKANIVYPLKYRVLFFLSRFFNDYNLPNITKDMLVEGVGSNIRSINRVLKELVEDGILEYNKGFIEIKDFDKAMDVIDTYLG